MLWLYPSLSRKKKKKKKRKNPKSDLKRSNEATKLSRAMISGFGAAAAKKLEDIMLDRRQPANETAKAALALALWHRSKEEHGPALNHLIMRRLAARNIGFDKRQLVLEIDTLLKLGKEIKARAILEDGIAKLGEVPELCYCAANAVKLRTDLPQSERDRLRLQWINKPLLAAGFAPVRIKDASRPLALDNIAASTEPHPRSAEAKISVLMPAYDAATTIATAIEGVLAQSWRNLELVAVDDGSSDDTWTIIQAHAARDSRVVAIRHGRNRGAYPTRNTALSAATGDIVTTHDSDDWSHPQKMAIQAVHLLDSGVILNTTSSVRVGRDMEIAVKLSDGGILVEAIVSLMSWRQLILDLGGWDEVRMSADDELYARLLSKHGQERSRLHRELPLGYHLRRADSLTAESSTGISTVRYGARREYFEASRYWHRLTIEENLGLFQSPQSRPYPVPNICIPGKPNRLRFDILLVSDFALPGGTTADNMNMLEAIKGLGIKCGVFHWPRLDTAGQDINPKIRKLLHEGIAQSVVAGERVLCDLVIVNHPPLLNQLLDTPIEVETKACVIVVNQAPRTHSEGGRVMYEIPQILANARTAFGAQPVLAPVSPLLRRILGDGADQTTAHQLAKTDLDWTPLLDVARWRWCGSSRDGPRSPIIGRHGRDSRDKWPSDPEALGRAYCAWTPYEVRLLGGADGAKAILGELPPNWTIMPFDSVDVQEFLGGLDFFVHYPHEHLLEAFGRAPMEAMASGVAAILPPSFAEIFGDAAAYAEPFDVPGVIERLWSDQEAYKAQVQRGRDFVERNCSYARFKPRVRPYLN
jgi:glycosyltransferase involved in cell wall biosynthesis